MAVTVENLETLNRLALAFLSNEQFGLKAVAQNFAEISLVERAVALVNRANQGEDVSRDEWTVLKEATLYQVGSPVADAVSRICSCMRNPSAAGISGLRDAVEKLIQANLINTEQRVREFAQLEFQKILG